MGPLTSGLTNMLYSSMHEGEKVAGFVKSTTYCGQERKKQIEIVNEDVQFINPQIVHGSKMTTMEEALTMIMRQSLKYLGHTRMNLQMEMHQKISK